MRYAQDLCIGRICYSYVQVKKVFEYIIYLFAGIGLVLTAGFFAIKFGLTNSEGIIDEQRNSFVRKEISVPEWTHSEEWSALKEAVLRDKDSIRKAASSADISPRLVVSLLVVEQLRLFYDNRELFKTVFAPLKILGNQSQFSWGVMGIKQETAAEAEQYLQNPLSPFYPGEKYQHLLDFETNTPDKERFDRLVNGGDRFYSYLYAALIVKELESQWKHAGHDIADRPDILATLYNIGFRHSKPNAEPKSGGAAIPIGSTTYSFGSLAAEFYYSDELLGDFPR